MSITIELTSETETRLKTQALRNGVKFEDYVNELIEEASERRERMGKASGKTFAEILAPIHKGFEESGMTEDEILEMFEQAREEVWHEQQQSKRL